jgi:hypothetical protein
MLYMLYIILLYYYFISNIQILNHFNIKKAVTQVPKQIIITRVTKLIELYK